MLTVHKLKTLDLPSFRCEVELTLFRIYNECWEY